MKKYILSVVCVVCIPFMCKAQAPSRKLTMQVFAGHSFGYIMSRLWLSDDPHAGWNSASGIITGVDMEYHIRPKYSVTAGLNWYQAGGAWFDAIYYGDDIALKVQNPTIKANYLGIPITANWYLNRGLSIRTGLRLGLMTSSKFSADLEGWVGEDRVKTKYEENIKSKCNSAELSIPVGVSYEFKFPVVVDFRVNFGLNKVVRSPFLGVEGKRSITGSLTAGYKFRIR